MVCREAPQAPLLAGAARAGQANPSCRMFSPRRTVVESALPLQALILLRIRIRELRMPLSPTTRHFLSSKWPFAGA